ncbi:hypothetical protein OEZ85_005617 [Tetradesmus obliquus]|uniref:Uncharacterized protein n=1 Tax=Tetradesmus obliquus TaxID=3088 RepID=A0ABY8UE04_TETOB|nr:hypothetical protein OEZ85_005617 [Tetradesmus obliquus]
MSTSRRKRSVKEYLDDKPRLKIVLAAGDQQQDGEPLAPYCHIVQLFSLCAAGLPSQQADSETVWDLSNILIDGQPVQRATVVAWLNACYQIVYKPDYEAQEQQDNPALTFEGLYRLLAFADAVDSTDGLMERLTADLSGLKLHAQLGEQQLVLCPGEGDYVIDDLQVERYPYGGYSFTYIGQKAANSEQQDAFIEQVAAQTEQLLWLAYRLQLEPLAQRLHSFVRSSCLYANSMLRGRVDDVFTPRVLDAAGASGMAASKQAVVDGVLLQEFVFGEYAEAAVNGRTAVLEPLDLSEKQQEPLVLEAKVVHGSLIGIPSGSKVRLELDLFGKSTMQVNEDVHHLHLCIGRRK